MNFDYAKDSKEQRPYEHYLAAYKDLDPNESSDRTGISYDEESPKFPFRLKIPVLNNSAITAIIPEPHKPIGFSPSSPIS